MKLYVCDTPELLGAAAARETAEILNAAIAEKGSARILLSTGASQFTYLDALVKENVDWQRVEMFHLDEYIGIPSSHKASFQKYLLERFVGKVPLQKAYFVNGEGDVQKNIETLTAALRAREIDVGAIGIGENAHIAFNDPPADFEDSRAYKVVTLDEKCRRQQVREGWFKDFDSVCKQAVTMTCSQIMKCRKIISAVPYAVKAEAIAATLENDLTNTIPATLLKQHADFSLYCDRDSIGKTPAESVKKYLTVS